MGSLFCGAIEAPGHLTDLSEHHSKLETVSFSEMGMTNHSGGRDAPAGARADPPVSPSRQTGRAPSHDRQALLSGRRALRRRQRRCFEQPRGSAPRRAAVEIHGRQAWGVPRRLQAPGKKTLFTPGTFYFPLHALVIRAARGAAIEIHGRQARGMPCGVQARQVVSSCTSFLGWR